MFAYRSRIGALRLIDQWVLWACIAQLILCVVRLKCCFCLDWCSRQVRLVVTECLCSSGNPLIFTNAWCYSKYIPLLSVPKGGPHVKLQHTNPARCLGCSLPWGEIPLGPHPQKMTRHVQSGDGFPLYIPCCSKRVRCIWLRCSQVNGGR